MYEYLKTKLSKIKNQPLLVFEGKKISIKRFFEEIDAVGAGLKASGIGKGDVVCSNLPNTVNAIVLFYAINKVGAVANIVHPLVPAEVVAKTVIETGSKMFFTMDFFYDKNKTILDNLPCPVTVAKISDYLSFLKGKIYGCKEPKLPKTVALFKDFKKYGQTPKTVTPEIAAYLHSGGTTGSPKTIMLTDSSFDALAESLFNCVDKLDQDPYTNRSLMVLPLFHGFGLGVCMHTLLANGFETTVMPRFNAKKAAALIGKRKITYIAGVPLMYRKLLDLSNKDFAKLKTLKNLFCGGDKLTKELKDEFDFRFTEIGGKGELQEGYGLTETVTVCTLNKKGDWEKNSMGYPIDCARLAVIDGDEELKFKDATGEICVSGDTLMAGYLNAPTDNIFYVDGVAWVKTGDWGYLNESGKLFLIDRIKKIFKRSGVNVFPSEIEEVVNGLTFVKECVAVYYDELDELCVFAGVPDKGGKTDEEIKNDILFECRKKLIKYSVPNRVVILNNLPKTAVGKIDVGKLQNNN